MSGGSVDREEQLNDLMAEIDEPARSVVWPLAADVAFLERRLAELRSLPMIEVHPDNPARQRQTQAARQYREMVQQYNSCLKTLLAAVGKSASEEPSPLRAYLESMKGSVNP